MKRSWIGFFLLIILLIGCILVTAAMDRIHDSLEARLLQSAQWAMEGNWVKAEDLFREAEERWEQSSHFRACFADHTPVEEIDASFELLKIYCAARESLSFVGGCRKLASQVAAVGEAHQLVWWNLI